MQTTCNLLLIRPKSFGYNTETAANNLFQNKPNHQQGEILLTAQNEFDSFVTKLRSKGIRINVIEDTELPLKPDAVFPNNWVTFHEDGTVILYPMFAPNRRNERRKDIIDTLRKKFEIKSVIDLSGYEKENRFLEGTGSIIFDHENRIAYACLSPRTDRELFLKLCGELHYLPIYFHASDGKGTAIYHTNVMMCIGKKFAVICLESIKDVEEKSLVSSSLVKTGHEIIDITLEQVARFAGNMLAVRSDSNQDIIVLSQSAFNCLLPDQKRTLDKFGELLPLSIPMIEEISGGSARCMIAEIFTKEKKG